MTVDVHRAAEPETQPEAEVEQGPKAQEASEVAQAGPSEGKLCLHLV